MNPQSDSTASDIRPIHALMSGLVDYAGLFPPAKLPMDKAVAAYAKYLESDHSWMLGRFILPVSRLAEFEKAVGEQKILPTGKDDEPWPISAIVDADANRDLDTVFDFNRRHSSPKGGLAVIDAIEIKVPPTSAADPSPSVEFIENTLEFMAEGVFPFFELSVMGADPRGAIAALAGAEAGAKIRTGGITPDAFPPAKSIADFLVACHAADVPLKATAGLHHAIRAEYPLTYEPNCPKGLMHGFLNVFVAAIMVHALRLDTRAAAKIIEETNVRAFAFDGEKLTCGPLSATTEQIEDARDMFALSYGSCSFEEPVDELKKLGLV